MKKINIKHTKNFFDFFSPYYRQTYKSILSLINKFFWKTKTALVSMFFLPLLFMIIYYSISFSQPDINVFSGFNLYICFSILPITLVSMPQLLVELKQSIILRRISTSNISSFRYIVLMSFYFFIMCMISTIVIFALVSAFEYKSIFDFFAVINLGQYIYSIINFVLVSISLGIIISSILKSASWVQILGVGIILFSMMVSGLFIPLEILGGIDAIKIISLISPLDYPLSLMNNCMYGAILSSSLPSDLINVLPNPNVINNFGGLLEATGYDDVFNDFGWNVFNFNSPFQVLNISGISSQMQLEKPTDLTGIKTIIQKNSIPIYLEWEKILNISFVYFFISISTYLSIKKFTWSSR